MVYLVGDTHGSLEMHKVFILNHIGKLNTRDKIIVLGDFGVPFLMGGNNEWWSKVDKKLRDMLSEIPCDILFVDGNHDNHVYWARQPITTKYGGQVQKLEGTENVYHLLRGETYKINRKSYWVFGGAKSIDAHLREYNKTWWPAEIASQEEMDNGVNTLEKSNWQVDYILTHTLPTDVAYKLGYTLVKDPVGDYLSSIKRVTTYKHWYCGHFHVDKTISKDKLTIVYDSLVSIK